MPLFTSKKIAGIAAGAAYGLAIRFGLANPELHQYISAISTAFLFVCPFSVGAIAVLWGGERGARISVRQQIALATSAMWLLRALSPGHGGHPEQAEHTLQSLEVPCAERPCAVH